MEAVPSLKIIYRQSEPTNQDTADYLALCRLGSVSSQEFYIQMSKDSENPRWEYLGFCNQELLLKLIGLIKDR